MPLDYRIAELELFSISVMLQIAGPCIAVAHRKAIYSVQWGPKVAISPQFCRAISPHESWNRAEALGWAQEMQRHLHLNSRQGRKHDLAAFASRVIHLHNEPLVRSNHALL